MFYPWFEDDSLSANQNMFGELENIHYLGKSYAIQSFYLIQRMTSFVLSPFTVTFKIFWDPIKKIFISFGST